MQGRNPPLLQLQGDLCLCPAFVPSLRDPLGILRAEPEQGEAEIREMRFGTRRLRLLEMCGSAGTWREAKINPESSSLRVSRELLMSAPAVPPFHCSPLLFRSSKSMGIALGVASVKDEGM